MRLRSSPIRSLRRSSSPKKVTPRLCCSLINALSSSRTAYRLRLRSSPIRSLRRSSSPKKVSLRLCCSLVNALATLRLATNFFRYQAVKFCAFTFPLVGNAHLVVTDCASLAAAFLAANAHSVVPPLVKKSRSVRLFAYKCAHNASLSLPTFCRFKRSGVVPFLL